MEDSGWRIEVGVIGTMPDREVTRRINRSLSAVRDPKFARRPKPAAVPQEPAGGDTMGIKSRPFLR